LLVHETEIGLPTDADREEVQITPGFTFADAI
jgi:hypothetical protein